MITIEQADETAKDLQLGSCRPTIFAKHGFDPKSFRPGDKVEVACHPRFVCAIMRVLLGHQITGSKAAEQIGVGFKTPNEPTLPTSSIPDPHLIALARILARQAARDFIRATSDNQERVTSRIKDHYPARTRVRCIGHPAFPTPSSEKARDYPAELGRSRREAA